MGRIKRLKADLADCREDISMLRSELGWLERDFRKHCALMEKSKDGYTEAMYQLQQLTMYLGCTYDPEARQLIVDDANVAPNYHRVLDLILEHLGLDCDEVSGRLVVAQDTGGDDV